MKNYEEVAKSVFEKSEKYFAEKAIRAKRIKTAVSAMSCFCLAAVITVIAVAAINSNLTEYPTGGGAQYNGENNVIITCDTTNDVHPEETSAETESLYTMPEMLTDENGDPVYPEINIPDDMWEGNGEYSFGSGIPGVNSDYNWQTPKEVLAEDGSIGTPGGVVVGFFLAYDGALYVSYSPEDEKTDRYYARTGMYAYFGEGFPCEAYAVKDEPNLIAIKLNFAIHEYRRLFYFNYSINGEEFQIAYSALKDIDHACGDMVLQTEDFTVYEAVRLQNGNPIETVDSNQQEFEALQEDEILSEQKTKEYIVDLLPVLKRELPNLFSNDGDGTLNGDDVMDYGDRWWIALPADTAGMLSHVDIQDDAPSLPPNTLSGVTPHDMDKILAEAKAASHLTLYNSVFVQTNTEEAVYSLTDSVVVMEGWNGECGRTIIVQTSDGEYIMYCHLSEIFVKKGDTAAWGKVIGLTGETGMTAHFGVAYTVMTSLPTPEKWAVILPEIPVERTEAELIEEIVNLGIAAVCVWSDNGDETVIPMEENAEVFSLTDGEVMWTYEHGTDNNTVCVRYSMDSMDTYVFYNHLSSLTVEKGDTVTEGQCIGHAGDIEFIEDIFDFGAGYRLSHTYYEHSTGTGETHHNDETHHSNNETHHG